MAKRGYGRATWTAPAACPPEVADAVHRLVDLWAETVERQRLVAVGAASGSRPGRHDLAVRFDHTTRRCRAVQIVLMGLYGRQQLSEHDLADAIEGYAASDWHRANRAWRTLSGWLAADLEDELLRWVTDGRALRHRREIATEARALRQAAAGRTGDGEAARAALTARAEAQLAALEAAESDRLVELERAALAALPEATVAMLFSAAGRPQALTAGNCRTLRALVLRRLTGEIERSDRAAGGQPATALGGVLPAIDPEPPY